MKPASAPGAPAVRVSLPYTWGATEAERIAPYPCDELVRDADQALLRAVEMRAPAAVAYRWLCQLRAAPYSYDALDNGFRRSPRRLTPGLELLEIGQRFMRIFELAGYTPERDLTLRLRNAGPVRLLDDLAVTYAVASLGPRRCRLICKLVVRYARRGPARWMRRVLPWGDLVMMRKQLRTLQGLAESSAAA